MPFFKIGGQRSRLNYHIVGKRGRIIEGSIQTERLVSESYHCVQFINIVNKRKMPIVFRGRWSKIKVVLSQSRKT